MNELMNGCMIIIHNSSKRYKSRLQDARRLAEAPPRPITFVTMQFGLAQLLNHKSCSGKERKLVAD